MRPLKYWLVVCITIAFNISCDGLTLEEELTLTQNQKQALDELKKQVKGILPHEYMYEEIYLIKFLRYNKFDIKGTVTSLKNNVRWREENKMDQIMDEDFSHFEAEFPFWLDGRDNDGRPVGTADISVWDTRRVQITRQGTELYRYAMRVAEMGMRLIREDQRNGKNITQFTIVANIDGFNLPMHACLQCIPYYLRFLVEGDRNFPGMIHKIFLVNTPSAFDFLIRAALPLVSQEYRNTLSVYGTNKKKFREAIIKEIPSDQIRPQFGGTKNIDHEDY